VREYANVLLVPPSEPPLIRLPAERMASDFAFGNGSSFLGSLAVGEKHSRSLSREVKE
jgi:hypothetical protein